MKKKIKVYLDGTDVKYHIPDDFHGVRVFFSEESAKANLKCYKECGITQLELDLSKPKVIVEEDFELAMKNAKTIGQIARGKLFYDCPRRIFKELLEMKWAFKELTWGWLKSRFYRIYYKFKKED